LKSDNRKQPLKTPQIAKQTQMKNSKLYVGNLSFETLEMELQDLFAQAGTVTEAALMQDRMTGKSRGFAFVTMGTPEEAKKAIELFNGKELHGRALTVNEARPREEGGPRRSFGGGGGGGGGNRRSFQRY
jgi:RNA recognition motif-containing protein